MEQIQEKKQIRGVVVSDKMSKSRVALVERRVKHPVVGKYMKRSTKYMFHDEENASSMGDEVSIVQTKPISGRKSFTLNEIIKKNTRV